MSRLWLLALTMTAAFGAKPMPAEHKAFALSAAEMRADDNGVKIQLLVRDWCELQLMKGKEVDARYGAWCSEPWPLTHEAPQRPLHALYQVPDRRKPLEFVGESARERMNVTPQEFGVPTRRTWEPGDDGWWHLDNHEIGRLLVLKQLKGEPTDKLRWRLDVAPTRPNGDPIPAVWGEPEDSWMRPFAAGVKEAPAQEEPDGSMPLQLTPRALFVTIPAGTLEAHGEEWACESLKGGDLDLLFESEASLETIGEYVLAKQTDCPDRSTAHLFHALRFQIDQRWKTALEGKDLEESRRLLREFSGIMEPEWVVSAENDWVALAREVLPAKLQTCLEQKDPYAGTRLLDDLGWTMEEAWVKKARLELYQLDKNNPAEARRKRAEWAEREQALALERVEACKIWYPRVEDKGTCEDFCQWKAGGQREGMELGYNLCVSECNACF